MVLALRRYITTVGLSFYVYSSYHLAEHRSTCNVRRFLRLRHNAIWYAVHSTGRDRNPMCILCSFDQVYTCLLLGFTIFLQSDSLHLDEATSLAGLE